MICVVTFLLLHHHRFLFSFQKYFFLLFGSRSQLMSDPYTGFCWFRIQIQVIFKASSCKNFYERDVWIRTPRAAVAPPHPNTAPTPPPPTPPAKNILIDYLQVIYIVPHSNCALYTYHIYLGSYISPETIELALPGGRRACTSRCWGKLSRSII